MQISQSDLVCVRQTRWRVTSIRAYDECQVLTLRGIGATNAGVERCAIVPFDLVQPLERPERMAHISRRLWRRGCRALLGSTISPATLRSVATARIDLLPHQLEPALAAVRGLATRLLLADDVGLGKTIQTGVVLTELRARGAADRILVIAPAGLRDQWAAELTRFGIDAAILDARRLRQIGAALPVGVNPWQTVPVAITSVDFVKRGEVLAAAAACRWDLVVVDEAHGVAGVSDRHGAVQELARRSSFTLLLTATPHSGDARAFASLCNIGGVPGDKLMVFRRSRHDVNLDSPRRIHRLAIRLSARERAMHALLDRFSCAVRDLHGRSGPADDCWLALSVLHKRALSSARSLAQSVERRLAAIEIGVAGAGQLNLPLVDPEGELTSLDESPPWSPLLQLRDVDTERRLLTALARAAAAASDHEAKIDALRRLLRRIDEPAIVFTEYRDTLRHVQAALGIRSVLLHGGMTRDERSISVDQFTSGRERLLLATDAAAEGLNLQCSCRLVINLELPWNPVRLEQRIGRVDRIGQHRTVHVFHLIARASNEMKLLARLQARIAAARTEIGGMNPLGDAASIARAIIAADSRGSAMRAAAPAVSPSIELYSPCLRDEGIFEARRIAAVRLFTKDGDNRALAHLEGLGPWVITAAHWRTRAALSGRTVMLWQVTAVDDSGRLLGSTVVAVAARILGLNAPEQVRLRVQQQTASWRDEILVQHRAFLAARLAREEAMESRAGMPASMFQPGLFDRRELRTRLAAAAAQNDADHDRRSRVTALEASRSISFPPPRLLFVITP